MVVVVVVVVGGGVVVAPVTANCCVSGRVPTVTVMVWAPAVAVAGMVMTLAISAAGGGGGAGTGVIVAVSNVKTIAVLAGKLEPMMVTAVPGGPVNGATEFNAAGAVTVKVEEIDVVPAVTATVRAPAAALAGIVTVLMNVPKASV